jgi:DNA mismatch endonuclease (patch repair protein)
MDTLDKKERSRCMSHIHSKDTKPELLVRRYLYGRGYRYRKNDKRLPGTPDIVMRKYGVVIFIHGCFWHGHDSHLRMPKSNVEFWTKKVARNKERDEENKEKLREMGWCVITVWECQLKPKILSHTLMNLEYYINENYLRLHGDKRAVYSDDEPEMMIAAEDTLDYGK